MAQRGVTNENNTQLALAGFPDSDGVFGYQLVGLVCLIHPFDRRFRRCVVYSDVAASGVDGL